MNLNLIRRNWAIITIVLIASFCRLYRIGDYMEFLGDQGRDVVIVRDFLRNGNLFFIGPQTSIGNMYLGPYYYYLIAPALLASNFDPIGPAILIAIIGIVSVYLLFWITNRWFDQETAIIASLLYALSPVVIKYSNFSWNPNIMPLFAMLFIITVSSKKYLLATLSFIMAINSHYLALLLLPTAIYIWLQNRDLNPKPLIIPLVILLLSYTPQVLFDIKHSGQNIKAISTFFLQRESTVNIKAYKAIPKIPQLHHQITTSLITAKDSRFGLIAAIILSIGSLSLLISRTPHFHQVFIWYLSGVIGLGLYKQHIYDHYFGFIFPAIFIITAMVIKRLGFLKIPLVLIIVANFINNSPLKHPLYQVTRVKEIVNLVNQHNDNQPFNFSLLAKQNYDPPYRYFFYEHNSPIVDIKDKITDQLFVVCEHGGGIDCNPINHPEWSVAAFGWAKIDNQWELDGRTLYRLAHQP